MITDEEWRHETWTRSTPTPTTFKPEYIVRLCDDCKTRRRFYWAEDEDGCGYICGTCGNIFQP